VFYPNYDVSSAGIIIPAADLSEQISTAGTEASGTGNMKLALNGALTIGTLDGANVEIREEVGEENIFIFGMTTDQVTEHRAMGYRPRSYYEQDEELREVLDMIRNGFFNSQDPHRYEDLIDNLLNVDYYMLLADYRSYVDVQGKVGELYKDSDAWTQMALLNTCRMGKFSIDRTVAEYAHNIWDIAPQCITEETMQLEIEQWRQGGTKLEWDTED
jgi:starch phosphorylase